MRALLLFSTALVSACASVPDTPPPAVVYREVKVPVQIGCVKARPLPVVPMNQQLGDAQFAALPTGTKAEAVKAQVGARLNYEDALTASVAGCLDAPLDATTPAAPAPDSKPAVP